MRRLTMESGVPLGPGKFHVVVLVHFSPAVKKPAYFPLYVFGKTRVLCYKLCNGKQKYQVTNAGVEKTKLSRLLVQRVNEFKINEIQRKTPK